MHVSHAGYSAENHALLQGPVFCRLAWHDVLGCNTSDFELSFSSSVNEDGLDSRIDGNPMGSGSAPKLRVAKDQAARGDVDATEAILHLSVPWPTDLPEARNKCPDFQKAEIPVEHYEGYPPAEDVGDDPVLIPALDSREKRASPGPLRLDACRGLEIHSEGTLVPLDERESRVRPPEVLVQIVLPGLTQ
ncbi:hypothetical protein BS47DRAFT_1396958 [Hydnum rufescens UP504]|uniref:Uncharacterized protein n=1 Tax=Hydnum rufescens UP504 TaxID=1448309 RepID=A0A9P6DSA6_9AGAM|nr:hypothetical protein BS47DRAFT_1396958 [Hydnum rufescens UP504]